MRPARSMEFDTAGSSGSRECRTTLRSYPHTVCAQRDRVRVVYDFLPPPTVSTVWVAFIGRLFSGTPPTHSLCAIVVRIRSRMTSSFFARGVDCKQCPLTVSSVCKWHNKKLTNIFIWNMSSNRAGIDCRRRQFPGVYKGHMVILSLCAHLGFLFELPSQ